MLGVGAEALVGVDVGAGAVVAVGVGEGVRIRVAVAVAAIVVGVAVEPGFGSDPSHATSSNVRKTAVKSRYRRARMH